MGRARWILALAALALLLLYALQGGERSSPPASVLPTSPGVLRSPVAEKVLATETMEPSLAAPIEGPREEITATAELALETPTPDEPVGEVRELSGRVTVLDPEGKPLGGMGGTLSLNFAGGGHFKQHQVNFEGDVWSEVFEVHPGWSRLSIAAVTVRGLPARLLEPRGGFSSPFAGDLDLVLRLPRPMSLRVVDLASGRDLDGVCLLRASNIIELGAVHPGPASAAPCESVPQRSPIDLEDRPELVAAPGILLGAPGYAWQRTQLDEHFGGERIVFLEQGADLDVQVSGALPAQPALLRLYEGESRIAGIQARVQAEGRMEFRGLTSGMYRLAVELGTWPSEVAVLAQQELLLEAGKLAEVHLVCVQPPARPTAPAAGIVRVPAAWEIESLKLSLLPLGADGPQFDRIARVEAKPNGAANSNSIDLGWSVEEFELGSFLLESSAPPFRTRLELPATGRVDFFVELPPPCELRVFVLDDQDGGPRKAPFLTWHWMGSDPRPFQFSPRVRWDAGLGCSVIRAPAGKIRLNVHAQPELQRYDVVELRDAVQEHVIRLRPASGVVLRVAHRGSPVEFPLSFDLKLLPAAGRAEWLPFGPSAFERRILVEEPGSYTIEVPKLPGYHRPAPRRVEIEAGRIVECVIELERERP